LLAVPANAENANDVSAWDVGLHSAARLIAGSASNSNATAVRAGIEIRLDPGWHTYWRYPGDSGVPPTFDFAGSSNVKSAAVLWPAPHRFPDGAGGQSIGYEGDFVLPIHVVPQDATKPAVLKIKIAYAVCEKLCIPAQARAELTLSGHTGVEDAALAVAETRVPRHVGLAASGDLAIASFHREPGSGHERVIVDVIAPKGAPLDLFVEGPTPEWSLPLPKSLPGSPAENGRTHRFAFDLDGLPPGAHAAGAALTFTAVAGDEAIEVSSHLD
jgi:DsbC/DsbD-like thiol-disulfide interchange protein